MKSTSECLSLLRGYMKKNASKYSITRMGIFGSVARGEQTEESDVDICLETSKPSMFALVHIKEELQIALKRLPERERMIMVLYYHENMTLKEIGDTINVSESRVCQLHAQAIMKLKNILSSNRYDRMRKSIV